MTSTPAVRTPLSNNWMGNYHDIVHSGKKSTPRRKLFLQKKAPQSPVIAITDDPDHQQNRNPRWSVESASSELKRTPIEFARCGFKPRSVDVGIVGMRFQVDTCAKNSERGSSICLLPTPDLKHSRNYDTPVNRSSTGLQPFASIASTIKNLETPRELDEPQGVRRLESPDGKAHQVRKLQLSDEVTSSTEAPEDLSPKISPQLIRRPSELESSRQSFGRLQLRSSQPPRSSPLSSWTINKREVPNLTIDIGEGNVKSIVERYNARLSLIALEKEKCHRRS